MAHEHWWRRVAQVSKRTKVVLLTTVCLSTLYIFCLPDTVFNNPYSTVLEARNGELLSASIAADGQWRFPQRDSIPDRFAEALITFEDKRFYSHLGVDPIAMTRALLQNVRSGQVVSGGSTITMQVVRLSRTSQPRSLLQKCIEMLLATRLEISSSKQEILALYASHAPFGGNVVGLDAACWRYFGRDAGNLSWGEAALLAVLPNAPSLIHPGKNRDALRAKRDHLLEKLLEKGAIDSLTCAMSKQEPIPERPKPLPGMARHLLTRMKKEGFGEKKLVSTLDPFIQQRIEEKLQHHHTRLKSNRINNGAVIILNVRSGEVLAYAGNVYSDNTRIGAEVDIITAPRSTGSILKPFLFAAALDEGLILPGTLLPDIPVMMNGFSPENFSRDYDGAVHAKDALIRSLNVPSVFLLKDYRYEKFHSLLKNAGFSTLRRPPDHYGLSLIIGGAEGTLWDITGMYASMARTLNNYFEHPGKNRYVRTDFHQPVFTKTKIPVEAKEAMDETSWLRASSIYLTFEALKEVYRPSGESGWKYFNTSKKIAWKTGTSFGFRDGWAIGVNPDYAVGVWVGNADGEGRSGLTGIDAAAPLLFDVFSLLPPGGWFKPPLSEMIRAETCRQSGQRASDRCEQRDTLLIPRTGLESPVCVYHKTIHVTERGRYQAHSGCADINSIEHVSWFVLPPVQEYFFKKKNISYKPLPPFRADCEGRGAGPLVMDLVYPQPNAQILIPRELNGSPGSSVFELAHRDDKTSVFWHLDGIFLGTTRGVHRLALSPAEGEHVLTIVDENGQSLVEHFTVISRL